ncbi:hypothetical protein [Pseudoxanthomonas sacheonensis]|uniref:Lipoprotein n=1 Tax=Pseudoxanthomonas sacheonensis TaxID=443615 RepID=A0ABU1RSH1_9GAMM|nr:hypothetical protein [Pseudoxanthomonas sacheonensis]MDR6841542.1 hypothetical protein [Pseudoxanthomonas sacheonensis]
MTKLLSYLTLITVMLVAQACAATSPTDRAACPRKSADDYYFANSALNQTDERSDAFVRHWYSKHLTAMGEPSLSCGQPGHVYRFTWLRTFHHPVVVRVIDKGSHAVVQAIELDGAGGYEPGKVLRRFEKTLSVDQLQELKNAFSEAQFGSMPTSEERNGLDGSEWIVEVSDTGKYHVVVRWSPDNGPIRDIGSRFLALTGWTFDEVY